MPAFIDLTGWKFGRLTVLNKGGKHKNQYIKWNCLCDCGQFVTVLAKSLRAGVTQSCGCLAKEQRRKGTKKSNRRRRLPQGQSGFNTLFYKYKQQAKKRGIKWCLTKEQFKNLTQQNCVYCGAKPNHKSYTDESRTQWSEFVYNGVDRVDPNQNYTVNNCVSCCGNCNLGKRQMTKEEFLTWIKSVYDHSIVEDRNDSRV